jgi:hypothetical protein
MEQILTNLLITIFLGWGVWISLMCIRNGLKINDLTNKGEGFVREFEITCTDLKNSFSEMKDEVKVDIESINKRLDTFMKAEIDTLKEIAKK